MNAIRGVAAYANKRNGQNHAGHQFAAKWSLDP